MARNKSWTGRPCRLIQKGRDKGMHGVFLTIIFSFRRIFPEAKAGGAFLIFLPYSTGHSVVTGTQTFRGAQPRRNGRERWLPFALGGTVGYRSLESSRLRMDWVVCGRRSGDDAHPETLLGIPGICSLALIANLQNTDAAAGMTRALAQEGEITERDKVIFAARQTSGSANITNYFSSGVAVFTFLGRRSSFPLVVILLFKFIGANLLRIWINIESAVTLRKGPIMTTQVQNVMDICLSIAHAAVLPSPQPTCYPMWSWHLSLFRR